MRTSLLHLVFFITLPMLTAQENAPPKLPPIETRIAAAQKRFHDNPKNFQASNDFASALLRKARDTQELSVYDQADAAIKHSLQLSPGNYDARKMEVTVLLGKHEFMPALKLADELNRQVRDDISSWALLVDTNCALKNYDEAERDAQWILDLRPGSALGFEKAALLREHFGDLTGAIEFLDETLRRTSANDMDGRAWLLTQKARLQLASGNSKAAKEVATEALRLEPDSQLASGVLAQLPTSDRAVASSAGARP